MNPNELRMDESERIWWERVRRRGSLWYLTTKGLLFLGFYPTAGCLVAGWPLSASSLLEGWLLGLVFGGIVWMRKELRYRFTLEAAGEPLPEGPDDGSGE